MSDPRSELLGLVAVFCRNPRCSYLVHRGSRQLVGRIAGRAELKCPSCRTLALYDVTVPAPALQPA